MSHSLNPTVNNKVNITIYENSVSTGLKGLGLQPIKPGDTVPVLTQKALSQMKSALITKFSAVFPDETLPASNSDGGYCGPLSSVKSGQAPVCAVTQISDDFSNWGISLSGVPSIIAKQITQEILSQGGQPGFASGTHQVTSAESIYWMCGYLTINITQTEQGILYVFGATEAVNL